MSPSRPCLLVGTSMLSAILSIPSPCAAHGPAPAPLRVLHTEDARADLVQSNIGIAVHTRDLWYRYVCPSQWGGLETPLSVATDASTLRVVGADGLYESRDRGCNFDRTEAPFDPANTTAMIDDGDVAWVLVRGTDEGDEGSRLYAWTAQGPRLALLDRVVRWDSVLVAGERLVLAAARPSPAVLTLERTRLDATVDAATLTPTSPRSPVESDLQRLTVRRVDGATMDFAAVSGLGVHWLRSDDDGRTLTLVQTGERSVHGPVGLCGGVMAVIDGEPAADPTRPPGCGIDGLSGRSLTCLSERDGVIFTCELRAFVRIVVHDDVAGVEPWFGLDQLVGPLRGCPAEPSAEAACQQDWLHYGAESGLLDPLDPFGEGIDDGPDAGPHTDDTDAGSDDLDTSTPQTPRARGGGDGDGCAMIPSATSGSAVVGVLWLLAALALTRRGGS